MSVCICGHQLTHHMLPTTEVRKTYCTIPSCSCRNFIPSTAAADFGQDITSLTEQVRQLTAENGRLIQFLADATNECSHQSQRVRELVAENERLKKALADAEDARIEDRIWMAEGEAEQNRELERVQAAMVAVEAENERLRAVLKPFAACAETLERNHHHRDMRIGYYPDSPKVKHCLAAREALKEQTK